MAEEITEEEQVEEDELGSLEDKVMLPISSMQLRMLGIDNVADGKVYGLVLTLNDLQRGYYRWKTLLGSPDVYTSDILDTHTASLVALLENAKKETEAAQKTLETANQHIRDKLGKITELEMHIAEVEEKQKKIKSSNQILQDLADKRLNEAELAKRGRANLLRKIERYQLKYGDVDKSFSWLQRFVMRMFRI